MHFPYFLAKNLMNSGNKLSTDYLQKNVKICSEHEEANIFVVFVPNMGLIKLYFSFRALVRFSFLNLEILHNKIKQQSTKIGCHILLEKNSFQSMEKTRVI